MRAWIIFVVAFLSVGALADTPDNSAPLQNKDQARQFAEIFMRQLASGNTYDAFALVKAQLPDEADDTDTLRDNTQQMLDAARPKLGKTIGYELLEEKSLGQSLLRYEYLLKLERFAVHVRIIFYKPGEKWLPAQMWVDQDIRQLFDDLGKVKE
jgi:hypothetical protein